MSAHRSSAKTRLRPIKSEDAAQSPRCKADERRGEGAYIKVRDRAEAEDNAADGVFGRAPNIVAVGGGTGMPILIKSLLDGVVERVDVIVTVADDGGSSGLLRREFEGFPPGDSRNCLVAMAEDSILSRLFQYRFSRGEGLRSHALGNLIISALADISGDFTAALSAAGKLIGARGSVLPSALVPLTLFADVEPWAGTNGSSGVACRVTGQCNVANRLRPLKSIGIAPADAAGCPEALEAIRRADVIILGPGSLFTSIMPNLLVGEVRDAVRASGARKIFLCNLTVQPGETTGFTASDHVKAFLEFAGPGILDLAITGNTPLARSTLDRLNLLKSPPVRIDEEAIAGLGAGHLAADLSDDEHPTRHAAAKLSALWRELF